MNTLTNGFLYIVATPIGNLEDMTLRAIATLKNDVTVIATEDTRHSKHLLQHYHITTKMISLHEHNEERRSELLLDYLKQGKNVALITDAGTPLISDPGYRLVQLVRAQHIRVIPLPGPCAAITALCASGLPTNRFVFEGFLPVKIAALKTRLTELTDEVRTIIVYEAPHRLLRLLETMTSIFGKQHHVVLAKELTKTFETIYGASLEEVINWLKTEPLRQKGEFVLLIAGKTALRQEELALSPTTLASAKHILNILLTALPPKQAVKFTAKITGLNKRELYKMTIANNQQLQ